MTVKMAEMYAIERVFRCEAVIALEIEVEMHFLPTKLVANSYEATVVSRDRAVAISKDEESVIRIEARWITKRYVSPQLP